MYMVYDEDPNERKRDKERGKKRGLLLLERLLREFINEFMTILASSSFSRPLTFCLHRKSVVRVMF